MTVAEFIKKWSRYSGKETSAYQEHFNDLCGILGQKTPAEADPTGNDFFCFQKSVIKDLGLLGLDVPPDKPRKGFADVWLKNHFGWEYKGKHKNLDEAFRQLQLYRESLLNPPLLVVCDFDRYIVRTNFNGTVPDTIPFTNEQLAEPKYLRLLCNAFTDPEALKPTRTPNEVTEQLAGTIAAVARSLQERESREIEDVTSGREKRVAQKKNLRIARFLNRIVFCFFAEDVGLLPEGLFTEVAKTGLDDPKFFAERLSELFQVMSTGGAFGTHRIRHFNGHLFEEATVFELTESELKTLGEASEADWRYIQPSIMGTLFERALDAELRTAIERGKLGIHYTSEGDIKTLVEPVLMAPLRREWAALRSELLTRDFRGETAQPKVHAARRAALAAFLDKLATTTVLDPACGSGNFLYVALQLLLGLEKEVLTLATQLDCRFPLRVGVPQLKAFEVNSYAFELAQVTVQIGWLQWRQDNGFPIDRAPVLQTLDGFQFKDALLNQTFRKRHKTLHEAQAAEHEGGEDDVQKVYTERAWPDADVIVGNPPFLGGKFLRRELGHDYVEGLFENYGARVPSEVDLCCYWFEKAREQIKRGKTRRAGLLATQGIRGGANREVLKRIKETGDIFFAISDREWVLDGANVHISMVGFDAGTEIHRELDGRPVAAIHANLSALAGDLTAARRLDDNADLAFMGDTKGGSFDLDLPTAKNWLQSPNPKRPNSDVLVPWVNGLDVTRRGRGMFIIDFGAERTEEQGAVYRKPFAFVTEHVKPERAQNNRELYRKFWWRHVEPRPGMLAALEPLPRFAVTPRVAKHRVFAWLSAPTLPDSQVFAFARDDDYFFGVLHSRFHEVWSLAQGTQLEDRPRYTPTTCFETFPFPFPLRAPSAAAPALSLADPVKAEMDAAHYFGAKEPPAGDYGVEAHRAAIAAAARELHAVRERWLNPPEWTREEVLEFPASIDGPWRRFVDPATVRGGIGTARYPRLVPRDETCAAELARRTLTGLYNERPAWLQSAHEKLDAAVAAAYGWPADLVDEAILERLLVLNQTRAATEERARLEAELAQAGKPKKPQREKHADELL